MENASKALIIAGAILLAIVIISLGLIVVNNVRSTIDNTNLSEQEIQAFNSKFTAYEGNGISSSRVNDLIQLVISSNQATADNGGTQFVTIGYLPSNLQVCYCACTYIDGGLKVARIMNVDPGRNLFSWTVTNQVKWIRDEMEDSKLTTDSTVEKYKWHEVNSVDTFNLSVKTGSKHDIRLYYKNGLVKCILVKQI